MKCLSPGLPKFRCVSGSLCHPDHSLTRRPSIDHAYLDLLTNWKQQHQKLGGQLVLDWDSLAARSTAR